MQAKNAQRRGAVPIQSSDLLSMRNDMSQQARIQEELQKRRRNQELLKNLSSEIIGQPRKAGAGNQNKFDSPIYSRRDDPLHKSDSEDKPNMYNLRNSAGGYVGGRAGKIHGSKSR